AAMAERRLHTLTVDGVEDLSGNVMAAASAPLFVGEADVPLPGDLVVNEVMFDPVNGGQGEYVELLNRTDGLFDLRRFALTDDGNPEAPTVADVPTLVLPDSLVVLVADRDSFRAAFPDAPGLVVEARGFPSLNNGGDLVVVAFDGAAIDSVAFDPDWHRVELEDATGIALERIDPAGRANDGTNWSSCLDPAGGTPGRPNSVFVASGAPPGEPGLVIDSPFDPDAGQSAAIRF